MTDDEKDIYHCPSCHSEITPAGPGTLDHACHACRTLCSKGPSPPGEFICPTCDQQFSVPAREPAACPSCKRFANPNIPEAPFKLTIEYVGSDCPHCGKKGTVFRSANPGGTDDIIYICCRAPSVTPEGVPYPPGHRRSSQAPVEFFADTPRISGDLKAIIYDLIMEKHRLDQIRKAIWPDMPSHAEKEVPQTLMKDKVEVLPGVHIPLAGGGPSPSPLPTRRPPRGPRPRLYPAGQQE